MRPPANCLKWSYYNFTFVLGILFCSDSIEGYGIMVKQI